LEHENLPKGNFMSRTTKEGKRSRRVRILDSKGIMEAIQNRMTWGSTEKILRRNRKIWERLAAKIRRGLDKKEIKAGLDS
jgi:hypothetical protein